MWIFVTSFANSHTIRVSFKNEGQDQRGNPVNISSIYIRFSMHASNVRRKDHFYVVTPGDGTFDHTDESVGIRETYEFPVSPPSDLDQLSIYEIYFFEWFNAYQNRVYDDPRIYMTGRSSNSITAGYGRYNDGSGRGRVLVKTEVAYS
jgi:hypothetical protein